MLGGYGDEEVGLVAAGGAAKRSGRDCEPESLGRCNAKRLKTEGASHGVADEQHQESRVDGWQFLTPAATPAYAGVATLPETISSPYSETEDYMFRGYYEDDLACSGRTCIESVQYNLYDMTPEELDDAGEHSGPSDQPLADAAWGRAPAAAAHWQQAQQAQQMQQTQQAHQLYSAELRCAAGATGYDDSYDIDM